MSQVAQRDVYDPRYEKTAEVTKQVSVPMQVFREQRVGGRPLVFVPTGNFDALRQQGKINDPKTREGVQAREIMREKKYYMPGYTGFIRGKQHISGRTYGEMTRRAYDTDYEEHLRTSPVPSGPEKNTKIPHADLVDTFVSNNLSHRKNHVPGYTGHVPGARQKYSKTYGDITHEQVNEFARTNPREPQASTAGFAKTSKMRYLLSIDSAPIPGTMDCQKPVKLVPAHMEYLRYFPQ